MRRILFAGMSLATVAVAAENATWQYNLPDTGVAPSYAAATVISQMGERHGGSKLGMQTFELTLPLSDPRRTSYGNWYINAQLDLRLSLLQAEGNLYLEHDEMYSGSLPITMIRNFASGNRLSVTVAPAVASDFGGTNHFFDVVGGSTYTVKHSDSFSYSVGVGVSPRFATHAVVPMFGFSWQPNEMWDVSLRFYKLSAMYKVNERLAVGPFLSGYNHSWMVNTERGDKIFRFRSLVAGVTGEYDFSRAGQRKRIITASVGSAVATTAQFCNRTADKDAVESHHYKPGIYLSVGVDFRF
ncbi:MAG: hypothetical protein IJ985_00865 [Akkermansia sp.]|nr:hypothetical protein [Akkermansia sp.]